MQTIYELTILDVQNEHDLEHDLEHKTLFSKPKIYDAKGDLNKRWYVYFSYVDPETGKLTRMKNIYGKANRYKNKESRYALLSLYRNRLLQLLKEGYSPFADNTELYQQKKASTIVVKQPEKTAERTQNSPEESKNSQSPTQNNNPKEIEEPTLSVREALDFALKLKTNIVNQRTFDDYEGRCGKFYKWLVKHHKHITSINQVDKKVVSQFLNEAQLTTSSRNRNNYRTCFSTIFQVLEDNEVIKRNFIKSLKPLRTTPKRNKTYSERKQIEIFKHLETVDPILLLFIKFISYNFLRPIEVCRLRVKDVDLETKTLQFQAKNKALKTKIIPEILAKELPDLSQLDGDFLLFTPNKIGAAWDTQLNNRRDYFSKRYKNVVKNHFNLGINYGLYSFRHTFITKLYKAMVVDSSPYAAKSSLMQITGHSTMDALEKYLRDLDAELPEDYSNLLN
tara:strand:- start:32831 stop:34183 length:1353 start_codon:yes stop_codon:yes gene_type:complete